MGSKFIALALAGGMIAGFATSCFRPVRAVAVDDTDEFADYLDTITNIATGGVLPTGALPVLAAQYALVYAYSHVGAGANALHGQGLSCAGFCVYPWGRDTYFGGGYCNDTGTAMGFRMTHSNSEDHTQDVTITGSKYLNDGAFSDTMSVRVTSSTVGAGYNLTRFTILQNGNEKSQYLTSDWNGEPIGSLNIGYTDAPTGYNSGQYIPGTGNTSSVIFYTGGYDFASGFQDLSGTSLLDDMAALHTALLEEYPEVDEQYYLDWDYDPGGGGTGCNCNVTVNVEPTINVEVNVEPTINVEVNVENQLPSEWLETIPEETTENPLEEFPTLEVENFTDILQVPDDIVGENSGFWWVCLKNWIVDNDKLWKYLLGLFTIVVIGTVLRGLH